jgi:hypothetical protein
MIENLAFQIMIGNKTKPLNHSKSEREWSSQVKFHNGWSEKKYSSHHNNHHNICTYDSFDPEDLTKPIGRHVYTCSEVPLRADIWNIWVMDGMCHLQWTQTQFHERVDHRKENPEMLEERNSWEVDWIQESERAMRCSEVNQPEKMKHQTTMKML